MAAGFIFVYGTLRQAAVQNRCDLLTRNGGYFSEGYLCGQLYVVDNYPGAIESVQREDRVFGELHRLADASLLSRLDDYEECSDRFSRPHEFIRKLLPIQLPGEASVPAWVYIYNRDVTNLQRIRSGDYLLWRAIV